MSARHARFVRRGDEWWVEDLDSRNGTWVDGQRLHEARAIRPGVRIRFGWNGPEVEVLPPSVTAPVQEVAQLRNRTRLMTGALIVLGLTIAGVAALTVRSQNAARAEWEAERAALEARTDSLLDASRGAVSRLEGEMEGLIEALEGSRTRVEGLQRELARLDESDEADPEELADLRQRLQVATAALARQQVAASLDATGLTARVRPAVALVYVEFEGRERLVATGFAVDGDGAIVTNRHVVTGPDGTRRPSRVGIQFSGSPQIWPADVGRVDPDDDLALLRTRNLVGGHPVVPGLNARADTLAAGSPVLVLGFPLAAPPRAGDEGVPRALSSPGVITGREDRRLEIQGWGAEGASGSPVVDATGLLVGVVYGGTGSDASHRLVAVPVAELIGFLGEAGP